MKGYSAAVPPWKRRGRGPTMAVGALVFFSLLVPLAFLHGFHNRFPSGFLTDDHRLLGISIRKIRRVDSVQEPFLDAYLRNGKTVEVGVSPIKGVTEKETMRPADFTGNYKTDVRYLGKHVPESPSKIKHTTHNAEAEFSLTKISEEIGNNDPEVVVVDGTKKSCQLEFGSYCLWSAEHKETMKDFMVKRLKDQLYIARAYYPSIAKLKAHDNLSRELKQNIQEHEKILSDAISDADLPLFAAKKIRSMEETIAMAKQCSVECSNVDRKLRQILVLAEDETHFHMKQSAFLYSLGVQTMPKSLHCFFMRLTVEWFRSASEEQSWSESSLADPNIRHCAVFSQNVLAASVTVNSTVMNSEETENMVFHVITDKQNYYAMKYWFGRHSFKRASIRVVLMDHLSPSEEFRITNARMRTEHASVLGGSHFLLPEILKGVKRVVLLDDDVVVQKDLSFLWELDMEGKVLAAVESCGLRLGQLRAYLLGSSFDPRSCVWMSGLNVLDLQNWRNHDVTGIYNQFMLQMQSSGRAAALPASLMAFQNLVYPLNGSWAVSGLGYDYRVSAADMKGAAALHFNGNMKPWLELGIPSYKSHWKKFLKNGDRFMSDCNVNL